MCGQSITASGVVVDHMGPLPGADVVEKGTTNGTITNIDGSFSLTVSSASILVFSCNGYTTQELPAKQNMGIVQLEMENGLKKLKNNDINKDRLLDIWGDEIAVMY